MPLCSARVSVDTAGMLTYQKHFFCFLPIARICSQVRSTGQNKTKPVNLKTLRFRRRSSREIVSLAAPRLSDTEDRSNEPCLLRL